MLRVFVRTTGKMRSVSSTIKGNFVAPKMSFSPFPNVSFVVLLKDFSTDEIKPDTRRDSLEDARQADGPPQT